MIYVDVTRSSRTRHALVKGLPYLTKYLYWEHSNYNPLQRSQIALQGILVGNILPIRLNGLVGQIVALLLLCFVAIIRLKEFTRKNIYIPI